MPDDATQYWATLPPKELAPEVENRARDYWDSIKANQMLHLWRRSHAMYYGLTENAEGHLSSAVTFGGDQGELVEVRANHLRSIVRYLLVTTTANRINYSPRATNTDHKSKSQVYAAKSLLEYYLREKHLDRTLKAVVERSLIYGKAYLWLGWDPNAGPEYTPETDDEGEVTGDVVHEGDITSKALGPFEVAHDLYSPVGDQKWYIVRQQANKYDVAARYYDKDRTELADAILECEPDTGEYQWELFSDESLGTARRGSDADEDRIDIFHFFHDRTEAVPDGRYFVICDGTTWLYDGPLPYEDLPVYPMYPEEFIGTSFGYTSSWDLLALQELYDALLGTSYTAIDAFGVPNVVCPDGCEIGVEELEGGLNLIKYPQGMTPPFMMEPPSIPKANFELRDVIKSDMETIVGVNSVARGDLPSNITSGAMAALVQAQALHFQSGLEASFIGLVEDSGTAIIRMVKAFGHVPRMMNIVGADNKGHLAQFSAPDIADIDRVIVDAGNPLTRTIAGRTQIADSLLERGMLKYPEWYLELLETGTLDSAFRPELAQTESIKSENEALAKGETVKVMVTDNPELHIVYHAAEANMPETRNDEEVVKPYQDHILEHMKVWLESDPVLMQLLGYAPPPPRAGEEGAVAGGSPGPAAGGDGAEMPAMGPPENMAGQGEEGMPSMPSLPENPLEGQQAGGM